MLSFHKRPQFRLSGLRSSVKSGEENGQKLSEVLDHRNLPLEIESFYKS